MKVKQYYNISDEELFSYSYTKISIMLEMIQYLEDPKKLKDLPSTKKHTLYVHDIQDLKSQILQKFAHLG